MEVHTLYVFDVDDTLLWTTAVIRVVDAHGKTTDVLTGQQFTNHTLPVGHAYDFSEFKNADKFLTESTPIKTTINLIKHIQRTKPALSTIIMCTAREDLDNKDKVLQTFERLGINMSSIHIHRAGNLPQTMSISERKMVFIRRYLKHCSFDRVEMFDDSSTNLSRLITLQPEFPFVEFIAWLVDGEGDLHIMDFQK